MDEQTNELMCRLFVITQEKRICAHCTHSVYVAIVRLCISSFFHIVIITIFSSEFAQISLNIFKHRYGNIEVKREKSYTLNFLRNFVDFIFFGV